MSINHIAAVAVVSLATALAPVSADAEQFLRAGQEMTIPDSGDVLRCGKGGTQIYPSNPQAAFDGESFLVVWSQANGSYGMRIDAHGTVLSPGKIAISQPGHGVVWSPRVHYGGGRYMLVWVDHELRAMFVSREGEILGPPFDLAVSSENSFISQAPPAVAFDGTSFFVAWAEYSHLRPDGTWYWSPAAYVKGARVTMDGDVLDPGGILISQHPTDGGGPAVAFNGNNFLVAWSDAAANDDDWSKGFDIWAARVSLDGNVIDPDGFRVSSVPGYNHHVSLASWHDEVLAVWRITPSYYFNDSPAVFAARVAGDGTVLDANAISVSSALGGTRPAVAFDGEAYIVAYSTPNDGSFGDADGPPMKILGSLVGRRGSVIAQATELGSLGLPRSGESYKTPTLVAGRERESLLLYLRHESLACPAPGEVVPVYVRARVIRTIGNMD